MNMEVDPPEVNTEVDPPEVNMEVDAEEVVEEDQLRSTAGRYALEKRLPCHCLCGCYARSP